jgi:aromatic ring-opening dioxygenase catalytic subunit (LigB family)
MAFQVRHVRIYDFSGFKSELNLIRYLLLYSPVLEKMIVSRPSYVNVGHKLMHKLMKELNKFKRQRASEQADVIFEM